jgi:hypothetical protein
MVHPRQIKQNAVLAFPHIEYHPFAFSNLAYIFRTIPINDSVNDMVSRIAL